MTVAKKEDLQKSFSGSSRRKKEKLSPEEIDRIAQEAEPVKPGRVEAREIKEEVVKTSLDFPVSIYEEMKIMLFKRRQSMRDYILGLVESDLNKNK